MTTPAKPTCRARWRREKDERLRDLRRLLEAAEWGEDEVEDLGSLYDYGLAFDYVPSRTFVDQPRGYWRWHFSPDELRFFADGPDAATPDRVEYVFLDWFDGHARKLTGRDERLAFGLWRWLREGGTTAETYKKAMEEAVEEGR